ncbi:hypothetical protein MTR_4g107695 [Medicago truncatula]|uniref:Uncharacterized protein n=1 Tax=Medicago truncatula TaxID=3880 RepID=A0A072V1E0_MEDTR|nr:hypothetical protein MTR_4g107695 [Medicago truncatula]
MWTVPAPLMIQQWYQSPGLTKGTTETAESSNGDTSSVGPFAETPATTIQTSKELPLLGEHDELMDSHLRGSVVVCKCELYVQHGIKQ